MAKSNKKKEFTKMLKKFTSALLLGAVLVFGASAAYAQPVLFSIGTNNNNDSVYVGQASSVIFTVNANGASIQGLVFAAIMVYTGGNWLGPMSDNLDGNAGLNNVVSAPAASVFNSLAWNAFYGQGTDPDTMLYGMTSFGGPYTGNAELFRVNFTPTGAGTLVVDPVISPEPLLPPANEWSALDPGGAAIQFSNDLPTIESVIKPNELPSCDGASGHPATVVFGDLTGGNLSGSDPDDSPAPLSFVLVSAVNSNATGPNNPILTTPTGWTWQTSNANTDDVGHWTLTFRAYDGMDESQSTCVVEFDVIAEQPLICFSFGCLEAYSGSDICVPLYATDYFNPCIELGGFDLLFKYDASLLTFKGIDLTGSILAGQGWEYLTYRVVSTNPALIRIVAIADMNNSNAHPNGWCLDGLLANICFRTTNDRNLACQSAWLMWYWEDCGDNTASSRDGNHLYIVADPAGGTYVGGNPGAVPPVPGGGIIMACADSAAYAQIFSGDGGVTGPAEHPCPNNLPNKPDPEELLCFVNGKIKIICPGDIDDRGDINLNGLAYEIADAVLYSNYFIQGPGVFAPPPQGEAQVAASDINADGTPLTVADLVYLIRVITGDAQPIANDLLGGGPKAIAGKVNVEVLAQGANTTVRSSSDVDMGAGLFVFNYSNTEISKVEVVGRASQMDVTHSAANGELRVLVYNIEDGYKVAAGHGEILSITTTGAGKVELVSVEAASFMGGALEANVTAKVLPTQFALQQNFPNPFNPSTSLAIDFPTASDYKLTIYNIAGQTVRTFAGNTEAGTLTLTWDGHDARGSQVATGVYFYSVEAGSFKDVKKMVLLK
jgi:hypothetical protein